MPARYSVLAVLSGLALARGAVPSSASLAVDFESHLATQDLTWEWTNTSSQRPSLWWDSGFVGNGLLGAYLFEPDPHDHWRIELSRMDVYDDRYSGKNHTGNFVYDTPRLPIGYLRVGLGSGMASASMRISLFRGELTANVSLRSGCSASLTLLANAAFDQHDVMAMSTVWDTAACGPANPLAVQLVAEVAESTWAPRNPDYVPNPPAQVSRVAPPSPAPEQAALVVSVQPHLRGTAHCTALLTVPSAGREDAFVAISPVVSSPREAQFQASTAAARASGAGMAAIRAANAAWWAAFWPRGAFVTTDATWVSSFWAAQWYKFASASRQGRGVMMDLQGPWFVPGTPWPDVHLDMNVQMQHYAPLSANRLDLFQPFLDTFAAAQRAGRLSLNAPAAWHSSAFAVAAAPTGASGLQLIETCYWDHGPNCTTSPPSITGNLLWVAHLAERHFAVSLNRTSAESVLFPLLSAALNFYRFFQLPGPTQPDGRTHLPTTFSPEFPYRGPDTNYDLQLYRWGLLRILQLADAGVGRPSPEERSQWEARLADLAPYPVGPDGLVIAEGVPLNVSHRHFSHLMAVWPLRTMNFSDADGDFALATRSVDHWAGMKGALTGFCRPAMSQMSAQFGRRAAAITNITFLLSDWIKPNTFYSEGANGPCTETPYAAAYALQAAMLSSWNGTQRVFAGVDDGLLPGAAFYGLRREGAFLVSARRVSNKTRFVAVLSEAGSGLVVEADMPEPWAAQSNATTPVTLERLHPVGPAMLPRYRVHGLPAWSSVVLFPSDDPVSAGDVAIGPAPGCPADFNFWGMKPGGDVPVTLAACGNGSQPGPDQQFRMVPLPAPDGDSSADGTFELRFLGGSPAQEPLCLGTLACGTTDGTGAVLVSCAAAAAARAAPGCKGSPCAAANTAWAWSPSPFANRLRLPYASRQQGQDMCLDVPGAIGPAVDLYSCDNHVGQYLNQEWTFNSSTGAVVSQITRPGWQGTCLTAHG